MQFLKVKNIREFFSKLSLKKRVVILLLVGTLVPLIFTIIFSYQTMSAILKDKLYSTFNSDLQQIKLTLENTINDMNYVSQQIYFSEDIRSKLHTYLNLDHSVEKTKLYNEINKELNLISFSNPNIGLSLIYLKDKDEHVFNSQIVEEKFILNHEPLLIKGYKINNFGPHSSMEKFNENDVLSTVRKLDLDFEYDAYLYIESNLKLAKDIMKLENVLNHTNYLIVNKENEIIYSENQEHFPKGHDFQVNNSNKNSGTVNGYYWFKETGNRGWSVISLISIAKYKQEMNKWIIIMVSLVIVSLFISFIVGMLLWRTIYRPIGQLNKEIKLMGSNNFRSEIVKTNIPEFVKLTNHFRSMKKQIVILINEVKDKERNRANLEIEKLMHQISPHFLMNTLDTAKWLSITGDKKEVTRLLSALNKILYYNMGKLGHLSTLLEEIDSMKQYLEIQLIRYDFSYTIHKNIDEDLLKSSVPRFILQPLVENSIYHGLVDEGEIEITISSNDNQIILEVSDNGKGISEEEIEKILNEPIKERKRNGMGIGLNYVRGIIEHIYGDNGNLKISNRINGGTVVTLQIPIEG